MVIGVSDSSLVGNSNEDVVPVVDVDADISDAQGDGVDVRCCCSVVVIV